VSASAGGGNPVPQVGKLSGLGPGVAQVIVLAEAREVSAKSPTANVKSARTFIGPLSRD
jgi:hypothetical protein